MRQRTCIRHLAVTVIQLVTVALFVAPRIVAAAPGPTPAQGFVVSPPTFNITADRGDILNHSIRVDNLTDQPLSLGTDKRNFTAVGDEGQVGLTTQDDPYTLAPWITVTPATAVVPAKSSQTFSFTVAVPKEAEAGGRFGSIVFRTLPKQTTGQTVTVGEEIGSLILLKVNGTTHPAAHLVSFDRGPYLRDHGPVTFTTIVHNDGNVHIAPSGTITIKDSAGHTAATLPVDPLNVLPSANRKFSTTWNRERLAGKYQAVVSLQYENGRQLTAISSFVAFPFRTAAIVAAAVSLLMIVLWRGRQRFGRALRILFGKE